MSYQRDVFHRSSAPFRIVQKGGQVGFTTAAITFIILSAINGDFRQILWGDVTHSNVRKYMKTKFKPILKRLLGKEGIKWIYRSQDSELQIGKCVIHFRTQQKPENWEGFNYDLILLNEAGLILRNDYIWEQAVEKMLWARKNSILIAGGVPKGLNKFVDLIENAKSNQPEYADWEHFHWNSYMNPMIDRKKLDSMALRNPGIAKQEIWGEVIGAQDDVNSFIKLKDVQAAQHRWRLKVASGKPVNLTSSGVDPSRGGKDECIFSHVYDGYFLDEQQSYVGETVDDGQKVAALYAQQISPVLKKITAVLGDAPEVVLKRLQINIDVVGIGSSPYDFMKTQYPNVNPMQPKTRYRKKTSDGLWVLKDEKTRWYWELGEMLADEDSQVCLPPDPELARQLCAVRFVRRENNVIEIEKKQDTVDRLGCSPDRGESCVYAFAKPKRRGRFAYK